MAAQITAAAMGDGTGEGREERLPWQPSYAGFDSTLLERRQLQSGIQMQARMIKNRIARQPSVCSWPQATSLISSHPQSEASSLVPSPGKTAGDDAMVYVRHYGNTRNWPNEESGIFEGTAVSSGTLAMVRARWLGRAGAGELGEGQGLQVDHAVQES